MIAINALFVAWLIISLVLVAKEPVIAGFTAVWDLQGQGLLGSGVPTVGALTCASRNSLPLLLHTT
jgi:hypothetical protein